MPRPTTKTQLIAEAQREFASLQNLLAPLSAEQMTRPGCLGTWSVKDTLAHLAEWLRMFFTWYDAGLRGEIPALPAPGYKWNQLPALNQKIYEQYRDTPLQEVRALLDEMHSRIMALMHNFSEEDLFTPGRFTWTGNSHLASYIHANAGGHYRWARAGLRRGLKAFQSTK